MPDMGASRRRFKDYVKFIFVLKQAIDSFGGGRQRLLACTRQPLGVRKDSRHEGRFEKLAPFELVQEIRSDIP